MSLWQGDELAKAVGSNDAGFVVTGVSIDSRTLQPGDLFVALVAERDGHDFVADAFAKGAAGALVSRDVPGVGPRLRVDDTLAALQRLGAAARARCKGKLIAVTGSVGKTTTKEMLRRILSGFGTTHAAEASFNNHIGVPLTLARMPRETEFAVLELGMNHPGEILPLTTMANPDAAIITTIERAHIGLMGSIEAIMREKASIFQGVRAGGTAIIPYDSRFYEDLSALAPSGIEQLSFGEGEFAEARLFSAESDQVSCYVKGIVAGTKIDFILGAPGRHMAMNAMAALAACHAIGLDVVKAADKIEAFVPVSGRGLRHIINVGGNRVYLLDESYNASAASIRAALQVLALQPGRHIAVLGDILELGDEAEAEHLSLRDDVIKFADYVFTCGEMMGRLFATLPSDRQGAHAKTAALLGPLVKSALHQNDTVLVKGSYGSRMRDVVSILEGPC
ncbi:MAG: UDP-N-acetylmuramoylalanyl-D-glutamate--2,6-diaminopimelate ligase [Acidocella sp. 20-57-95]|nr:MAG: UDP-N-acetylmuramoylalanyl-D-glutamate--2,6-diaminopimelate ligase [Acidocella sp. 20-57-95]OYV60631.1 MAG: UDP-N-acetylmuramoylalanyl-D-glutamate--2,6-diaminopimelate ligase [Acidocella sp. 21-58-7]HQT63360.1 UDP-N-acetylmuramoyl-tripeptide--D-alanyl-D-alanine ligase [Acidocella sp.]HQU03211.1 UDP-N-acetylmuramoyl-tripeptide--D-alanyl-D-alanine ligase [Acidocella sp.]